MASGDCSARLEQTADSLLIPKLHGPDSYHVYLGSWNDTECRDRVKIRLKERGFTLYESDPDLAKCQDIEDGIDSSRNVVLFLTPGQKNSRGQIDLEPVEHQRALEKVKVRGSGSLVLLLCGLEERDIPYDLRGYKTLSVTSQEFWPLLVGALVEGMRVT